MKTERTGTNAVLVAALLIGSSGCATDDSEPELVGPLTPAPAVPDGEGTCIMRFSMPDSALGIGTASLDAQTQVAYPRCILMPVEIPGEGLFWIAHEDVDIWLDTPDADDDPVRHAASTAEDAVVEGRFPMRVLTRDAPLDEAPLWSGTLEVWLPDGDAEVVIAASRN